MPLQTEKRANTSDTLQEQQQVRQQIRQLEPLAVPYGPEEIETSIIQRFERMVEALPDNEVARSISSSLTYAELNRRANRIAHTIIDLRLGPQQAVGLMVEHGTTMVEAVVGVLKSGNFYVPMDPSYPEERLRYIAKDAGLSIIITDAPNESLATSMQAENGPVINLHSPDLAPEESNPAVESSPDDYAYLIYTSGSTGNPKGVIENNRDVKWFAGLFQKNDFVSQADVLSGFWSLSFSGMAVTLYLSLLCGPTLLLLDPKKCGPARLLDEIRAQGVTYLSIGPPLFRKLRDVDQVNDGLPSVRSSRFAGSGSDRKDISDFFAWARHSYLRHSYGMSEVKHICSYLLVNADNTPKAGIPIGYACDGVTILLMDDDDNKVGIGEVGEIVVKSSFIGPGYWNLPEENAEKIYGEQNGNPERFFRTGDLGMVDENGCLFHKGRKDFQIKLRGYRIEPEEVELAIRSVTGVKDGAVGVRNIGTGDEELVGIIVKGSEYVSSANVRRELARMLPAYMVPTQYIEVPKLPTTESFKLDRKRLAAMVEISQKSTVGDFAVESSAPRSDAESKMANIWADALQRENVGPDDDFFEIGGDSLIAAVMVDQIYRVFGKRVPINTLFEAPTVAELARYIEALDPQPSSIVPVRPSGSKTPVFCFHSLGGSVLGYYAMARYLPLDYPVWAVQPRGTDGTVAPIETIPGMASYYCDEITRVQSEGEFILTGISLGAEIAFEVARELERRGRNVKSLILIDPATPLPGKIGIGARAWSRTKKIRQSIIYGATMRRHGKLSPQQARDRIYQNNIRAGRAYRNSAPGPIDVPATLIRAIYKDEYHVSDAGVAEWGRLTGGLNSIPEVYGAHSGEDYVLDEPNVEAVAHVFLNAISDQEA